MIIFSYLFEVWFTNAQSRLLGATYVAHSQSFQLYQVTYVERKKLDKEEDYGSEIYLRSKLLGTISKAASNGNFASAAIFDP